ncbi:hypothetical protein ABEB36_011820 [Hypothenemus hampei]|uniref:Calcineurin-like phosphoesterase domain-containing protein n=1 Tax=Hypothenemus hampei TaxID=57062 RepID=A0ABD1E964_HYPHA
MRIFLSVIIEAVFLIILLFTYCEFLIYYIVQIQCGWPELDSLKADPNITSSLDEHLKVVILADIHLLGSRHGHWFDKLRREWQMYRAFQTALTIHKPEVVFVLGDLLDEGSFCSDKEFDYYVDRFNSLFGVPDDVYLYMVVGNHDIGFHYAVQKHRKQRFDTAFNTSGVQLLTLKGSHFVLVNSIALEGDGCSFCYSAEVQLAEISKKLLCTEKHCDLKANRLEKYSRPILMQHYPLFRESDEQCDDFDSAPMPQKRERFREKWECLSKEATYQLLKQIKPRLVLSGHTHHGCTRNLALGNGIEITMPSFSWRNKNNPNYALVRLRF